MSEFTVRLDDFFDKSTLAPARLARLVKAESVREALATKAPKLRWPGMLEQLMSRVKDIHGIDVPEIAAATWNKYQTFQEYADSEKYPPDETFPVDLVTHTITSEHKPYIEILVHNQPVTRLEFKIELAFVLDVDVGIRDGKIVEIRVGSCQGKGSLNCEGIVLAKREIKPIPLPDVISLREGIPINRVHPDAPPRNHAPQ